MGIDVVVDSDDLEKLLYATGAIKQIESAISNQKNDPWYQSAESGLQKAHVALNKAWLNAKRGEGRHHGEIDDCDIEDAMKICASGSCPDMFGYTAKRLRNLGLIEFGNTYDVVKWADTGEVSSTPHPVALVRLSAKGKNMANNYQLRKEKKFLGDNGVTIDGEVAMPTKLLESPAE